MIEKRIAIAGTGEKAAELAGELNSKKIFGKVTGFIAVENSNIHPECSPVVAEINEGKLSGELMVDEIIISLPPEHTELTSEIYSACNKAGINSIKVLPPLSSLIDNKAHFIQTREIEPEDILERKPVKLNLAQSLSYLKGKRVLITGAGGSIGSEITRQLLKGGAQRLYLFDHNEDSLYQIEKELKILQSEGIGKEAIIVPVLGDLKDRDYTFFILNKLKADVIFHCAAFKHVPMSENNPVAVIQNNVFATKNLLDASMQYNLKKFVLISTDKAVEPTGIYGASKKLCEEIVLNSRPLNNSSYMVVRFGNVLGSRGSIIPLFKEQIKKGGPVTVTHPDVTRFFMTIPEAVSLVLKTGDFGKHGQTYILDMGEPVKILDLAKKMITFSGFTPDKEIHIKITGLRSGEKLHEKLYSPLNEVIKTDENEIMLLKRNEQLTNTDILISKLDAVINKNIKNENLFRNKEYLYNIIMEAVPTLKINL